MCSSQIPDADACCCNITSSKCPLGQAAGAVDWAGSRQLTGRTAVQSAPKASRSRRPLCNTARRWRCRTSADTRHKSRTPAARCRSQAVQAGTRQCFDCPEHLLQYRMPMLPSLLLSDRIFPLLLPAGTQTADMRERAYELTGPPQHDGQGSVRVAEPHAAALKLHLES